MGSSPQTAAALGVCMCMFRHALHKLSCWHASVLVCDRHIICNSNCQCLWNWVHNSQLQCWACVCRLVSKHEWWTMVGSESREPVGSELSIRRLHSLTCDSTTFPHIDQPLPPTITGLHTPTRALFRRWLWPPVLLASIYLLAKQHCNWLSNNKQEDELPFNNHARYSTF